MTTAPGADSVSHVRSVLLVFAGGAVGTGVREAFALASPAPAGTFPVTIFLINVVGAFVLGALLGTLSHRGPDTGRRRDVRLLLGTGVLGGFTTYSAFAVDTALLLDGAVPVALAYVVATLAVGFLGSVLGLVLADAVAAGGRTRGPGR